MYSVLWCPFHSPVLLQAYLDADWACCVDEQRSTGGFAIFSGHQFRFLAHGNIQSLEYKALVDAAADISWIQSLLFKLGIPLSTAATLCVYVGEVYLTANPDKVARIICSINLSSLKIKAADINFMQQTDPS